MKITLQDTQQKGFAVLHGKWGGSKLPRSIIGLNGQEKKSDFMIGYYAYPNVGLKNIIPDSRFFGYEKLIKQAQLPKIQDSFSASGLLQQSVTKKEYIKKIKQIKKLLYIGEIYQMCYAIRFRKKLRATHIVYF